MRITSYPIIIAFMIFLPGCGFISLSSLSPEKDKSAQHDTLDAGKGGVMPKRGKQMHALIIGVGDYVDSGIPDLKYAANDANALASHLLLSGGNEIRLLRNQNATKLAIREEIWRMKQSAKPEDLVLIFWAGHCAEDRSQPGHFYLLPYDTEIRDLKDTAYSIDEFRDDIETIGARDLLVAVDTCHSGGIGEYDPSVSIELRTDAIHAMRGVYVSSEAMPSQPSTNSKERKFDEDHIDPNAEMRLVFTACGQGESSIEDDSLGHGVFTYYLLRGLQGDADNNSDDVVTLDELIDYTKTEVVQHTGQHQNPMAAGDYRKDIPVGRIKSSGIVVEEVK